MGDRINALVSPYYSSRNCSYEKRLDDLPQTKVFICLSAKALGMIWLDLPRTSLGFQALRNRFKNVAQDLH